MFDPISPEESKFTEQLEKLFPQTMPSSIINVTVPHRLTVEEAAARLSKGDIRPSFMAWLESVAVSVKLVKIAVQCEAGTLAGPVPLTVVIDRDRVTVESGPVSRIMDTIGEHTIASKLAEALKP